MKYEIILRRVFSYPCITKFCESSLSMASPFGKVDPKVGQGGGLLTIILGQPVTSTQGTPICTLDIRRAKY